MSWLLTASRKRLDLINPTPDMIDFFDIARALARTERFAHQCPVIGYSVLQHSLLVASLFDNPMEKLYALLHDAHEAYTGDIPTPVKNLLRGILELEERLDAAIFAKAGLYPFMPPRIRERVMDADLAVLRREVVDLFNVAPETFELRVPKIFHYAEPIRVKNGLDLSCTWLRLVFEQIRNRSEQGQERDFEACQVVAHHGDFGH